jgi:hypothetical protein
MRFDASYTSISVARIWANRRTLEVKDIRNDEERMERKRRKIKNERKI